MQKTVLIGDTVTDLDTARAAGVAIVLVTFGHIGRDVARLGPDDLLDHFQDLPKVIVPLIG